jgi:ABC-type glycerol-3-phosphate transport system substrate-binding protein
MLRHSAGALRAAGLDPNRPPKTIAELDAYAAAMTVLDSNGHIARTGYLPKDPGWYLLYTPLWFGGDIWDEKTHKFTLTSPACVAAYNWIQSYSKRLGRDNATQFFDGLGNFDSPQNPFMAGMVGMEQQGPWMANFIRRYECKVDWAVAPFPSAVPGLENVSFCPFDALCIPKGAAHPKEAFEFIAYVNRQAVMEKLCSLHCKNSPLAKVSEGFIRNHPNRFIKVYEDLASSPNAHATPHIPTLEQVQDELKVVSERLILLDGDPATELAKAQAKLQAEYDDFMENQRLRDVQANAANGAPEVNAQ